MATHDPEDSPAGYLGAALRRARVAAGFTSQDALATRLGFDRSVVAKAETGDRPPTLEVLAAWCSACNLTEAQLVELVSRLARRTDGPVPEWFAGWLDVESRAHTLRLWSPLLVSGLLQTADYARTLFLAAGFSADQAAEITDARLARQAIMERIDPPQLTAVFDEAVLHRKIGSAVTMTEQLDHLAEVGQMINVSIHILPATDANAGLSGSFALASADGLPDTLVLEAVEDQTSQDRALVRRASIVFDLVRREALPRRQSRDLIVEASNTWKTSET
jgi:transcriptional regulator with XRE-family HTH domain